MNSLSPRSYWGTTIDCRDVLGQIAAIGPALEANAAKDEAAGDLSEESFALLKPLRFSHLLTCEELGGAQMRPTEVLQLLSAITYHSGAAGWVSMVQCCLGAIAAAFLPDSAVDRLFAAGSDNRFAGQSAPLGMLRRTQGGYLLSGKWSYGSGFSHATWSHSACFIDDGSGAASRDAHGNCIIMCAHAPIPAHQQLGNWWDVMGLRGTGSIDYAADNIFVAEDMVFTLPNAPARRLKELSCLGVAGLSAIGHTGWAMGAVGRMLDEISAFAESGAGRACALRGCEKFWYDYGRAEAAYRAARALIIEVWSDIERSAERGQNITTRQISLVHLAKAQIHEVGVEVSTFAFRASGGAGLRNDVIQRCFRDMMAAVSHICLAPAIVSAAGRDLGGPWSERIWQGHELVKKQSPPSSEPSDQL